MMKVPVIPPKALVRLKQLHNDVLRQQQELARLVASLPAGTEQDAEIFGRATTADDVELLRTWGFGKWPPQPVSEKVSTILKGVFNEKRADIQQAVQLFARSHEVIIGFPPDGTFAQAIAEYQARIKITDWHHANPAIVELHQLSATVRRAQKRIRRMVETLEEAGQLEDKTCLEQINTLHVLTHFTQDFEALRTWGDGTWATDIQCALKGDFEPRDLYAKIFDFSMREITTFSNQFAMRYKQMATEPYKSRFTEAIEHARKSLALKNFSEGMAQEKRAKSSGQKKSGPVAKATEERSVGSKATGNLREKILAAHQQKTAKPSGEDQAQPGQRTPGSTLRDKILAAHSQKKKQDEEEN